MRVSVNQVTVTSEGRDKEEAEDDGDEEDEKEEANGRKAVGGELINASKYIHIKLWIDRVQARQSQGVVDGGWGQVGCAKCV